MKAATKGLVLAIALIAASIVLAGCTNNRDSALVGRWMFGNEYVIEFNRDGTGVLDDITNITWSAENGRLTLAGFADDGAGMNSPFEWNGTHNYRAYTDAGVTLLTIWLPSPSPLYPADYTAVSLLKLGEN